MSEKNGNMNNVETIKIIYLAFELGLSKFCIVRWPQASGGRGSEEECYSLNFI